ncbi:uncharacterized protein TNCV_2210311 [Trichonephila clavipes]|nr:uncharacterized protein TNCV_2210311 [Trichonephila clavipes]
MRVSPDMGTPESRSCGDVRYATAMYIYTLQDAHFFCYKQSPYNARSVAFSQSANSPRMIEDETLNNRGIINNLIDYVDGQEDPDSLRAGYVHGNYMNFGTSVAASYKYGESGNLRLLLILVMQPGSSRPRQTSCREDLHIRNARVQLTATSAAIQAQVAPSKVVPESSRTLTKAPG